MVSHAVQPSPLVYTLKSFEMERMHSVMSYQHLLKLSSSKTGIIILLFIFY